MCFCFHSIDFFSVDTIWLIWIDGNNRGRMDGLTNEKVSNRQKISLHNNWNDEEDLCNDVRRWRRRWKEHHSVCRFIDWQNRKQCVQCFISLYALYGNSRDLFNFELF